MASKEELLKVSDLCQLFSVSDETIYKWIKTLNLPAIRIGKLWFFKKEEIDIWLAQKNKKISTRG